MKAEGPDQKRSVDAAAAGERPLRKVLTFVLFMVTAVAAVSGFLAWQRQKARNREMTEQRVVLDRQLRRLADKIGVAHNGRSSSDVLRAIVEALSYDGPLYDRERLQRLLAKDLFSLESQTIEAYDRLARKLSKLAASSQPEGRDDVR